MSFPQPATAATDDLRCRAEGLLAETGNRQTYGGNSQVLTTQQAQLGLLGLGAGILVTNIVVTCITAGAGLTLTKAAICDKTGKILAVTADVSASFASTGPKALALTSAYTIPSPDGYYACIVAVGVTPPTLHRDTNFTAALQAIGTAARPAAQATPVVDLVVGATLTLADPAMSFWFGVS